MKPYSKSIAPTTRRQNQLRLYIILFMIAAFQAVVPSYGQNCSCPMSKTLVINTGYDPATNNVIAPGTPTTAAYDPYWTITGLTPPCMIPGAMASGPAFVVPHRTGWVNPLAPALLGRWVNFGNFTAYNTAVGNVYTAYYTRRFYLCHEDDVTFNIKTAFDNGIKIILDAPTALPVTLYSAPIPTTPAASFAVMQTAPTATVHLMPGWHSIDIEQYNEAIMGLNGQAFLLIGTISTPSNALSNTDETAPVASIPSITPLCGNQSICVTVNGTPGATVTYAGMFGGAPGSIVLDGAGTGCIYVTVPNVSVSTSFNLILTGVTTPHGCPGIVAGTTVVVNPSPEFTFGPDLTVCSGTPYTLTPIITSSYLGSDSYSWSTGETWIPLNDVHLTTMGTSYLYTLTISNTWGCSATHSIVVNIEPKPVAGTISGPGNFCANIGSSFACSISGNNGIGIWSMVGGGSDVTIDAMGHLYVNPLLTSPTTVTVYYKVTNSCGVATASHTFTVYPAPAFTINGPSDVCSGDIYTLTPVFSSSYLASHTYSWSTGSTAPSITDMHTTTSGVSYIYNVVITNSWGCWSSLSKVVNVHPLPAPTIRCPKAICKGSDVTVYALPGFSGTPVVSWTTTPGTGSLSLSSPTAGSVIIHGVTAGTAILSYTVTDPASNCSGTATCIITINPTPDPITGPATVCEGSMISLSTTSTGGMWSSSNSSIASVDAMGHVTGVLGGTAIISYTFITGNDLCPATMTVTVVPKTRACVHASYTPASNLIFVFTATADGNPITGPVTITFEAHDCLGAVVPIGGLGTFTSALPYTIDFSAFPSLGEGICSLCVTSVTYMGCTWPVTDCCIPFSLSGSRPGFGATWPEAAQPGEVALLTVVPNPNTGVFTLSGTMPGFENAKDVSIEIMDVLGKTLVKEAIPVDNGSINKTFSMNENVANGMYLIKVKTNTESKTIRFTLDR